MGDNRIVDYFYDALPSTFEENDAQFNEYVATLKPRVLFMDGIVRVLQYLCFVAAAVNIGNPERFARIIAILLLANAFFSEYVLHSIERIDGGRRSEKIRNLIGQVFTEEPLDFNKCRRIWRTNNLAFGIVVLMLVIFGDDYSGFVNTFLAVEGIEFYTIGVLLIFNSIIDLIKCDHIYRPRFHELLGNSGKSSTGKQAQ